MRESIIALKEVINEKRAKRRNLSLQEQDAAIKIGSLIRSQAVLEDEIIACYVELDKMERDEKAYELLR